MPLPDRPLSAVGIRLGGDAILFDCGEGTQVAWRQSGFSARAIDTILLSHMHADHVTGLPGMLFQIAFADRTDPVTIYAPAGSLEIVTALCSVVGGLPFEVRLVELAADQSIELSESLTLSTIALHHRIPTLGYRLDLSRAPRFDPDRARELNIPIEAWSQLQAGIPAAGFRPEDVTMGPRRGIRLSLIGDTATFPGLADFVVGSDLLVCESTYLDDEDTERARERGHMTMRQALDIAITARADEVWLTHFSPKVSCPANYSVIAKRWHPRARIGQPGMTTTLAYREDDLKELESES